MYANQASVSSYPLQLLVHLSPYVFILWTIETIAMLGFKYSLLPYPENAFGAEIFGCLATAFIGFQAKTLTAYGNILELMFPLIVGVGLYAVTAGGLIYFLWYQTYVALIDFGMSLAVLCFLGLIVVLGMWVTYQVSVLTPWTMLPPGGVPMGANASGPQLVPQHQLNTFGHPEQSNGSGVGGIASVGGGPQPPGGSTATATIGGGGGAETLPPPPPPGQPSMAPTPPSAALNLPPQPQPPAVGGGQGNTMDQPPPPGPQPT
eukprot:PhF_6_TR18732/c0_g1_i2/m.27369